MLVCASRSEVIVKEEIPTSNLVPSAGIIVGNSAWFVVPSFRPITLASALLISTS